MRETLNIHNLLNDIDNERKTQNIPKLSDLG